MSIKNLLTNLAAAEESETARLLAGVLNFDRLANKLTTGRDNYLAEDVQRIGRVLAEYAPNGAAVVPVADAAAFRPIAKAAGGSV